MAVPTTASTTNTPTTTPTVSNSPLGKQVVSTTTQITQNLSQASHTGDSVLAKIKKDPLYMDWRNMEDQDPRIRAEKEAKAKLKAEQDAAAKKQKELEKEAKKALKDTEKADKEKTKKESKESKDKDSKKESDEKTESKEKKESSENIESKKSDKDSDTKKKKGFFSRIFRNPNISYNPFSRGWNRGKAAVKGAIAVPGRVVAKAAHIIGRPQQLFEGEARSDMAKNTGRGFANFFRGITGGIYKPHRTPLSYENAFKDYGPGRGPTNTKNPAKLFCWAFGKFCCPVPFVPIPKIASHVVQSAGHFLADTVSGKFDYTHTSNAIKKAVSWDHVVSGSATKETAKVVSMNEGAKVVSMDKKEEKKAA